MTKLQKRPYKWMVATPCSWGLMTSDVGVNYALTASWLLQSGYCGSLEFSVEPRYRIHTARNAVVLDAMKKNIDFLLWIDPDMRVDVAWTPPGVDRATNRFHKDWALPFLPSSLDFMVQNDVGVIGAHAVSIQPECKVNVFVFRCDKPFSRITGEEYSQTEPCFMQIAAIGTAVMLIDMSVFKVIDPPYFEDLYDPIDRFQTDVCRTQDSVFCFKCNDAGIPVFGNFYAPAGHHKDWIWVPPFWDGKKRDRPCPTRLRASPASTI